VDDNLGPDVRLALSAIAAELGVDPDSLPTGIGAILHAFGAARYGEGARDWLVQYARTRVRTNRGFPAPRLLRTIRDDDTTPIIGRHGRRRQDDDGDDGGGSAA